MSGTIRAAAAGRPVNIAKDPGDLAAGPPLNFREEVAVETTTPDTAAPVVTEWDCPECGQHFARAGDEVPRCPRCGVCQGCYCLPCACLDDDAGWAD